MTTEYGDAASKTSETNPLRISNLFHLTLGAFNVLGGGVMAFLLTREAQIRGLGLIPALAIAASLLVLGLTQIARAWRDEKFRFHPDDIGDFAAPEKFSRDGKPDQAGYLIDVINNGVQPSRVPDNALLNKLYNWLPKLELAPQRIRWHAETQAVRIVKLLVATLGFALAWIFAKPHVFAWLAPIYLLLAISPLSVLRGFSEGRAGDPQFGRPPMPRPAGAVAILLGSIFLHIVASQVVPDSLPPAPYATATIVVPTIAAIGALLIASILFLLSLKAQTRELTTSGVGHKVRKDLNVPNLSSGLIDSLLNDLPYPRRSLIYRPGWSQNGDFGGELLVETDQKLNASRSAGGPIDALRTAWTDDEQQPLVGLGGFGLMTGIAATLLAFAYARTGSLTVGLTALSLFSASQFSLLASHGLWNRVDFSSTLYRIFYKGSYRQAQRVAGNTVTGSGTLTESTTRVEHVEFWVAVTHLESVAFARSGLRYVQSLDLKPDECDLQFKRVEDYYNSVMQRKADAYREEGAVRQLVQGSEHLVPPGSGATDALLTATSRPPPVPQPAQDA